MYFSSDITLYKWFVKVEKSCCLLHYITVKAAVSYGIPTLAADFWSFEISHNVGIQLDFLTTVEVAATNGWWKKSDIDGHYWIFNEPFNSSANWIALYPLSVMIFVILPTHLQLRQFKFFFFNVLFCIFFFWVCFFLLCSLNILSCYFFLLEIVFIMILWFHWNFFVLYSIFKNILITRFKMSCKIIFTSTFYFGLRIFSSG